MNFFEFGEVENLFLDVVSLRLEQLTVQFDFLQNFLDIEYRTNCLGQEEP